MPLLPSDVQPVRPHRSSFVVARGVPVMHVSIHEVGTLMLFELILYKAQEKTIAAQRKHAREQVVPSRLRSQPQALPKRYLFSVVRGSV